MAPHPLSFIPSPSTNGFHIGPLFIHIYGLMYVIGITLAILLTQRRVRNAGGNSALVGDIALWAVPAGIIGGRIYFDITTPSQIPHVWYGVFAVWSGGLGIWGGIAAGALVGAWRVRRAGQSIALFADAIAPALLVAQAIGRIGNYFNKELFGGPTTLPWALEIPRQYRPHGYHHFATFQPTFLYELIWDLLLAALLIWIGSRRTIRPPGLFALYVAGYSAFRIFEESLRIDNSEHFLGLRLNFYVAGALTIAGIAWFVISQRRTPVPVATGTDEDPADSTASEEAGSGETGPETAATAEADEPEADDAAEETATADDTVAGDRK